MNDKTSVYNCDCLKAMTAFGKKEVPRFKKEDKCNSGLDLHQSFNK